MASSSSDTQHKALHFIRTPKLDGAPTILLLHAVGYDLTYYDRQVEALQPTYNVVAVDLPGHGRSPPLQGGWTLDNVVGVLSGFVSEVIKEPVHLVGISFGSMLAQALTIAQPQLIKSLTLIGSACTFNDTVREAFAQRAAVIRKSGMSAVLEPSLHRWFSQAFRNTRPDVIDRVTKTLLADDAETHASIWQMLSTFDVSRSLSEVKCPVLLLIGDSDPSTPPSASQQIAQHMSSTKAELAIIPEASHIVTVEAPTAVNTHLLRFLGLNK